MASKSGMKRNFSDMSDILEFIFNDDSDMKCDLGGNSTDLEDLDSEWQYESDSSTDNLPGVAPSNEFEAPISGHPDTDPPSEEDIPPLNSLLALPDSETEEEIAESDSETEQHLIAPCADQPNQLTTTDNLPRRRIRT